MSLRRRARSSESASNASAKRRSPSGVSSTYTTRASSPDELRLTRPASAVRLTSSVTVLWARYRRFASSEIVARDVPSSAP